MGMNTNIYRMKNGTLLGVLLCLVALWPSRVCAENSTTNPAQMLQKLDESLTQKTQYEQQKLQRIAQLKAQLPRTFDRKRYALLRQLYKEYASYQYDSAYTYALQMNQMALQLRSQDFHIEAQCAQVFCLLSAGLFHEGVATLQPIDIAHATAPYRKLYFTTAARLYYDLADYTHAAPYVGEYIAKGSVFTDSLLHYLPRNSDEWLYASGLQAMKWRHFTTSNRYFKQLLSRNHVDAHTRAIITSCMGWTKLFQHEKAAAICLLAQAAIYDNVSATRETTALCTLARLLYEQGDIQRATEYVRQSLQNANFYGARQRVIEVSGILPIIEQDRYRMVESQRNALASTAIIAVLFVIALLVFTYFIRRQMRKTKQAQAVIAQRKAELERINAQLREANTIKDEYIGQSFYANAEYINKVEKLYRTIDAKIVTRQFADLRASLKEHQLMDERKSMFEDFDKTFLNLFPHFITRYNQLFDDAPTHEKTNTLTTEMRIFALIRLGINDSERIAKFLHYSIHTINTYKTRVKNKSKVDNDQFEAKIMEI